MANKARYEAMLTYLRGCPVLEGILAFQTGEDNTNRILTIGSDASSNKKFIDGSVGKIFDFTIEFYKELNRAPYADGMGENNLNLGTLLDVQAMIDWLDEMQFENDLPDFGEDCVVDSIRSLSNEPLLAWVDSTAYPLPIAKYTVTVRVEYIDFSKCLY